MRLCRPSTLVVAIPVRDEVERIGSCLAALAAQQDAPPFTVVLLLNNCRDGTAELVKAMRPALPFVLDLIEVDLPAAISHVGTARALAMERAAELAGANGILFATDADGEVAPDWIRRNLLAFERGVEAVAGRSVVTSIEHPDFPPELVADNEVEERYADLLDAIGDFLDHEPYDPLPRHTQHSGASIAVTVAAYRRAGGVPRIPSGEDRAFFDALRRVDAKLRHDESVYVTVSGRVVGRAPGGMADTIRRRLVRQDEMLDRKFERVDARVARYAARARLRKCWQREGAEFYKLCRRLGISAENARLIRAAPYMGTAWAWLETHSPRLAWKAMRRDELPFQIQRAERALAILHAERARATAGGGRTILRLAPMSGGLAASRDPGWSVTEPGLV
ncbi:Glycosyl transferase family 2 [Arboricoccus pini]|uniref:Glycosyl transferase family 2 n=2 Tax=Arboricoccus pini TaxID=1963835 RepID=A0A212S232_9PROT|nr:Glycosyl transferase family 2 [Arboricoccus pini]